MTRRIGSHNGGGLVTMSEPGLGEPAKAGAGSTDRFRLRLDRASSSHAMRASIASLRSQSGDASSVALAT
jgi:hypothetical protein